MSRKGMKWGVRKPLPPTKLPVTLNGQRFKLLWTQTVKADEPSAWVHVGIWLCLDCGTRITVETAGSGACINDPELLHKICPTIGA